MAAGILAIPGIMPSRDRSGRAVVARIRVYVDNTTTPTPVYTTSALNVAHSQPIASDDAGRFPLIWADNATPVTLAWETDDDQSRTITGLSSSSSASVALTDDANAAADALEALLAGYSGAVRYTYSTTTSDADPGAGLLRLNNATPSNATIAYIDNLDANAVTATTWLDSFDDANTGTGRGVLTLRNLADPSQFAVFLVSGTVINGTGYRKVPITFLTGSASFDSAANLAVSFTPAGPTGAALDGWTPTLAVISDSARRVHQVIDWTGGGGTKPATGKYVGLTGLVTLIADAIDIRGPVGLSGAGTGDLIASNNLSDVSSVATARTNLGLGTAATKATGTTAGNVVEVQTGSKLPALDGSDLTNIVLVGPLLFGDGSDGSVTISGTVTLSRDMYYDDLTIAAGADLRTNGWLPFVKGTLDLTAAPAGGIKANGANGGSAALNVGGVAGTASTAHSVGVGKPSSAGLNGNNGDASQGAAGVAGGNGGAAGGSGASYAAGTAVGDPTGRPSVSSSPTAVHRVRVLLTTTELNPTTLIAGGGAGASGAAGAGGDPSANTAGGGGASGAGGDILAIYAKFVNRGAGTAVGALQAKGGAGGNGAAAPFADVTAGVGGGGGGGGWVYLVCQALLGTSAANAVDVTGGAGGAGGAKSSGVSAADGGGAGGGGRFTLAELKSGSLTDTASGVAVVAPNVKVGINGGLATTPSNARFSL